VTELTYAKAITSALDRALSEDDNVLVYGEDVGVPGGIFGCTMGLRSRHGERVFDTPISEAAILGSAVGAAMFGKRPVVEIMWVDFSLVALDQIINQAANIRYVSEGRLIAPITVRTQQGAQPGSCAQHSQNLEAFFAHTPGILVGLPSNPQDAHDMLLSAIATDDPVVIIENRNLYFTQKAEVEEARPVSPPGGARVMRDGADLTLVSWSAMVHTALEAAEVAADRGMDVEVIDLRWLRPLDMPAIIRSVGKTSRLMVVHEANLTGGFGAEIAARVGAEAFDRLDAPIRRVGVNDVRMPAAPNLQSAVIPDRDVIVDEMIKLGQF
jgi:pyruvate/2-oxoglutarate/acetoin dehydrogenase E1 component